MNRIQLIDEQLQHTRALTKKLLENIPTAKWYDTPEVIESNIAWQVGHLMMSQYIHHIAVVAGMDEKVGDKIPFPEYVQLYIMGSKPPTNGPSPNQLLRHFDYIYETARKVLLELKEEDLDQPLEVVQNFQHPVAKTKYEALMFGIKHEMWHAGQMSMIKRTLGVSTDWFNKETEAKAS